MYTEQERQYASGIIRQIARNHQVSQTQAPLDLFILEIQKCRQAGGIFVIASRVPRSPGG